MKLPRLFKKIPILIHLLLWLAIVIFFVLQGPPFDVVPDNEATFQVLAVLLIVFGVSAVPAALVCCWSFCKGIRARDISLILQSSLVGIAAGFVIACDMFGVYMIYVIGRRFS